MKFTICIPTFNRADVVGRAIDSVLSQTYSDWELLVIDDGSTDNTSEVIEKYSDSRITYIRKDNGGKHTVLNKGFKVARGDYFIILDSDDALVCDCLEKMLEYINLYDSNETFIGIMGKCRKMGGQIIGENFSAKEKFLSYVDFHFRVKRNFGDCCEAIKTNLLKPYRYPEGDYKFIPERYVFDQIDGNLYCTNDVLKEVEYRSDGITNNAKRHLKNNAEGFLIDCINKIEVVFPKSKKIKLKKKFKNWVKYWVMFSIVKKENYRVKKVSFLGALARIAARFYKL